MNSSSHNCPIEMRLEWSLGNISVYKFCSGICAWCADVIVDELGSFALIGLSGVSLVWNVVVIVSR